MSFPRESLRPRKKPVQLPLYDVDATGSLSYTFNIYSAISEFRPRLWKLT